MERTVLLFAVFGVSALAKVITGGGSTVDVGKREQVTLGLILSSLTLVLAGCDDHPLARGSIAAVPASTGNHLEIDFGVVLADHLGYFCLPFEQVGLTADAQVMSVESSCECVLPRVVTYRTTRNNHAQAILLEFVDETHTTNAGTTVSDGKPDPADLGVVIQVNLTDGNAHKFTISFCYTTLVREEPT